MPADFFMLKLIAIFSAFFLCRNKAYLSSPVFAAALIKGFSALFQNSRQRRLQSYGNVIDKFFSGIGLLAAKKFYQL